MAQTLINVGAIANDGTGDEIRRAGIYINANFIELYARPSVLSHINFLDNNIVSTLSNANINLEPSGTGAVQLGAGIKIDDNNITALRSNDDIKFIPQGSGGVAISGIKVAGNNIYATRSNDDMRFAPSGTGKVIFGAIKIEGTTISSDDSTIININDGLIVDGTGNVTGITTITGAATLETTLAVTTAATTLSSTLSVAGTTNLTTTSIDNLNIYDNYITSDTNADINITPGGTGNVVAGAITFNGTTLSAADSSLINVNEALDITGALSAVTSLNIAGDGATVTGIKDEDAMGSDSNVKLATQQSIKAYTDNKLGLEKLTMQGDNEDERLIYLGSETWTWAGSGGITADGSSNTMTVNLNSATGLTSLGIGSLTFAGNDITSSSNADINVTPGGTGAVNMSNTTIDGNINLFDNTIQTTQSNSDLIISGSGTGQVIIAKTDMNSGTVDNTTIGVTTPAAGTFTVFTTPTLSSSGITITDNVIKANSSNADLTFEASGSGYVVMEGYQFPNADGGTGQVLRTDGNATLTWVTSPILLGSSDIQDGQTTIGFSSETAIDAITATGGHELIQSSAITINSFAKTKYDSAWYLAVTREENDTDTEPQSFATAKFSVLHDNTNTSITTTNVTKTDSTTHITATADVTGSGLCRLRGTGATSSNAVSFFRIGLGDDDSTGSQTIDGTGKGSVIINTDVDSTVETLDSWAHTNVFNVSTASFVDAFSVSAQEINPRGLTFNTDGTKMFVCGWTGDDINEYTLGTGFDVSTASFVDAFSISGENDVRDVKFNTDGTKMFVCGRGNDKVYEYALTTVFDVSTASLVDDLSVASQDTAATGLEFNTDGTKMFILGAAGNDVNEYTLSVGFDISSTVTFIDSFSINSQETSPIGLAFNNDGTKMFVCGFVGDDINEYALSTGFDVSTASFVDSFDVSSQDTEPSAIAFNTDGTKMFVVGGIGVDVNEYTLTPGYRGAKYYISCNNTTNGEISNLECILTNGISPDGSTHDAFISVYNEHYSGNNSLITLTADIDGSDVRLRGSASPNTRVHAYRILLGDAESTTTSGNLKLIGAQTVNNSAETIIDADHSRGSSTADFSSQKAISQWTSTDFDSAWYYYVTKDQTNNHWEVGKFSLLHGTTSDGSTLDAFVSDSHNTRTGSFPIINVEADISSENVRLLGTGNNDGSTTISDSISYYRIGLGDNTVAGTSGNITKSSSVAGGATETSIDAISSTGAHSSVPNSETIITTFPKTQFDSAWYLALTKDVTNTEVATAKLSVVHNNSDAFISHSNVTQTGTNSHITTDADISGSDVRLKGTGISASNLIGYYRIGLGDNDSTGSQAQDGTGKGSVIINTDIDSAVETLDSWAHASYRGAKYYISVNNASKTENGNIECIVVHNGSDAFIMSYGETFSNSTGVGSPMITLTADISGSDVRLRASGGEPNLRVHAYRILLGDAESDTTSGDLKLIGAQTVSNNLETTIDSNTARGTNTADFTSAKSVAEFTDSAFDSAWYHIVWKDQTNNEWTMNKYSLMHGTTSDGSTKDAFISDSSLIRTGTTSITTVDADISSNTVRIRGTGYDDSSTAISNVASYYKIGLGDSTSTATSGKISTHAGVTIGGNTETRIDLVTASGTTTAVTATERTVASFTAGSFDSAWYYVVTKDINGNSVETQKISLMHNASTAFITSSGIVQTDPADQHPTFDADITSGTDSTSTVRLRATDSDGSSVSSSNTMAYYRIGLGDDDSTGYVSAETDEASIQVTATTTIDSAITTLDWFGGANNAAAKYFISVKNTSTGEVGNMEALVTHNDSDSFVSVYNEHYSGNNSLLTITADYDSGNARLRGSATAGSSTRVSLYRILLGDTESADTKTNTRTIANVTVSSTATAIDTFTDGNTGTESGYDACHYIVTAQRGSVHFVTEATVVTDGTNAYISQHGDVSTKTTPMLELTAAHDGSSTVTLSASSTTGASTIVNAWRINLKAPTSQVETVDTWAHGSNRGAKYYISAKDINTGYTSNIECLVVHNGTTAYITSFNEHFSNTSLVTLTADIDGSNVRLLGTPAMADVKIKFYKIMLADNESGSTGTDINVIAATTVSSASTTLDTFDDTVSTGAHYIVVGWNSGESAASISEVTVLTDGTTAYVTHGPEVSTKGTGQLNFTAAHEDSSIQPATITLSATSTSGGSTTVNAYRIHMLRGNGTSYTELDSFASTTYLGAHYIVVGKNTSNESMIAELTAVTDGTGAYHTSAPQISTHSTTTDLMTFTTAYSGGELKLRAENIQEGTSTTVNMYRVGLFVETTQTLDSWSASTYRGAKYHISMNAAGSNEISNAEVMITHDGTAPYIIVYNEHYSGAASLMTFTTDLSGGNVRLRALAIQSNVTVTMYRIIFDDSESGSEGTDTKITATATVSSAATAIDTFDDTSVSGAHYIVVGWNATESAASMTEVTVVTDGTNVYVSSAPDFSTKETGQLTFTATHDGSSTVTLLAASTSGSSTVVNAYRIHLYRDTGSSYDELDSWPANADGSTGTYNGAHYIVVGKNASNESMISELTTVSDGTGAYITTNSSISSHSLSTELLTFTTAFESGELKLRAINTQDNTTSTVNLYRVALTRATGDTTTNVVLDEFDSTVWRSAKYNVQISDEANSKYELFEANVTHDGTTPYLSMFGSASSETTNLATITVVKSGDNIQLKGEISTTDDHVVKFVRRVIAI